MSFPPVWIGAAGGVAGVAVGWLGTYIHHRIDVGVSKARTRDLADAVKVLGKAFEDQNAATREQFAEINRQFSAQLAEFSKAWREEVRVINQHVWELAGRPERRADAAAGAAAPEHPLGQK